MEIAAALAFFVPLAVALMVMAKRQGQRVDAAWLEVADKLDGSYTPERAAWVLAGDPRRIVATVGGRRVVVDHFDTGSGKNRQTHTRITTEATTAPDSRLTVTEAGLFSGLARAVGFQDVAIGDVAFDEKYIIKSDHPGWATLWLNEAVRRKIRRLKDFKLQIENGEAILVRENLIEHAAELLSAVKVSLVFADSRAAVLKAWKPLAKKYDGRLARVAPDFARLAAQHAGAKVTVETCEVRGEGVTRVRAELAGGRAPRFDVVQNEEDAGSDLARIEGLDLGEYSAFGSNPGKVEQAFDERTVALLFRVSPVLVSGGDSEVELQMAGAVVDVTRCEAAVELGVGLAVGMGRGIYR